MLDLIRRKQKSTIVKLVFWVIIAAFVGTIFLVWGRGNDRGGDSSVTALRINGDKIALDTYQRAYSNLYSLYESLYREQFTPEMERQLGLKQMALERVVDQTLLAQQARKSGIKVSKEELVESIAQIPSFQENGVFSRGRYLQVLQYQRISPDEFEAAQRRQILIDKMIERIEHGVSVSEEEIADEFRRRREEVNLDFISFDPARFESKVQVEEAELAAWFDKNREEFRTPATVALKYVEFNPENYRDEVVLSEEELERHYRRTLGQFEIPEQMQASHILIRVEEDAEQEKINKRRELAEKVLQQIKAGEDFADLARRYSDDDATAREGGALGYFPRGTMTQNFERAAFDLEPGEVSDIVRTSHGFHIIKATGHIEAGFKPLEEVVETVRKSLREEKAKQLAIEKAMDAYNLNRKGGSIEGTAQESGLNVEETDFFARDEAIPGIGRIPEISQVAFSLEPGELAKPVVSSDGVYLFTVKERRPSRLPELSEVREKAEERYRREKSYELAEKAAKEAMQAVQNDKSLAQVAQSLGVKVEETGTFSRTYETFIPRIGNSETMSKDAFTIEEPGSVLPQVYEVEGKFVVAVLKQRSAADMAALDEETRKELRTALQSQKEQQALEDKLASLREEATIEITPALSNLLER